MKDFLIDRDKGKERGKRNKARDSRVHNMEGLKKLDSYLQGDGTALKTEYSICVLNHCSCCRMNAGEQLGVYSKAVAVLMKRNGLAFIWFIGDGCDDRTDGRVMKRESGTSAG